MASWFNGSGTAVPFEGTYSGDDCFNQSKAAGNDATADEFDAFAASIADTFENCLTTTGETKPGSSQDWNGKTITNLGAGTGLTHAPKIQQVQNGGFLYAGTATGGATNTYVASMTPGVSSYVAGQVFRFLPDATNGSSSTLNINSKGAKAIRVGASIPLVGGELVAGQFCEVFYDGTQFHLVNPRPKLRASVSTAADSNASAAEFDVFDEDNYAAYSSTANVTAQGVTYTAADGKFTVSRAGLYQISGVLIAKSAGIATEVVARIKVSGSAVWVSDSVTLAASGSAAIPFSFTKYLAAAAYVNCFLDAAAAVTVTARTGSTCTITEL